MAENENVLENEVQPEPQKSKPSKGKKIGAAIKEWFRKRIVALKRSPHNIPLVFTVIVTAFWLVSMFNVSKSIAVTKEVTWTGIAMFGTTMLSILIIPLFLNAFPKRKKTNWVFFALLFVFMVGIVLFQVLYYVQESAYLAKQSADYMKNNPHLGKSLAISIAHMVLIGIDAVLLATLPLYKKLILKINTKKVVESNELTEEIDTSEADETI